MQDTKKDFIALALASNVLKFGDFELKSGRRSPYFFNAGLFYTGFALKKLGQIYAARLMTAKVDCQHLFGPAYKGLPLATTTAVALADYGIDAQVTFNRKEQKDHGEGGQLIGAPLTGNIVMVDDVITAGTAFRESKAIIEASGARLSAVVIALDRCERGLKEGSTLSEIRQEGISVLSIITVHDLMAYLESQGAEDKMKRLQDYYDRYGVF